MIIHPDGYILTNKHVVEEEESIKINRKLKAKIIWISKGLYDLALIKIESDETFPYLSLERKHIHSGTVEEYYSTGYGMWAIIEMPAFFKGYIRKLVYHTDSSHKHRCQFLAHSCETYNGGSGGPIINSAGNIVGINFQNILFKYKSLRQTQEILISKLGFAISNQVYSEIVDILFASGLDDSEKLEFIESHYWMNYYAKPYL